jgi:PAS domain S-box-containing protein
MEENLQQESDIFEVSRGTNPAGGNPMLDVVCTREVAQAQGHSDLAIAESVENKEANAEIELMNRDLERRVVLRTLELARANEELRKEIIERTRVENELRKREAQLREAQRLSQIGSWEVDLINDTIEWSDEMYRIFGIKPGEFALTLDTVLKMVHPDDCQRLRLLFDTAMKEKEPYTYEHRVFRADGTIRIMQSRGAAVVDKAGVVIKLIGTGRDITDNKRAQAQLRESETLRRMVIDSEPECVKLVSRDCTLLDMNPAGLAMIEADNLEQVVGHSILSLVAEESRAIFQGLNERIFQGETAVAEFEIVGLKGTRRWMESHAAPLRNPESKIVAQLAITRDITDRKRAEASLRIFRSLIDQSNDAIEVIDNNTFRFLDCNQSAYQSLGYSREEFLNLTVFDVDPLVDRDTVAQLDEQMKAFGFATLDSVHRRKDGSTFPVEVNVKVVRLERDYRLAVVRNITERKRAEEALRKAEQKYRDIFENAGEGIFQSTSDGRFLTANPAMARMLGYDSPEELIISRNDIERQHYVDPDKRKEFKRLVEANEVIRDFEYEAYCKDRSIICVTANVRSVRDQDGILLYYEGTAQDITERRRAETALKKQTDALQEIFDHLPLMIRLSRENGEVSLVNRQWEQTIGWTLEEIRTEQIDIFAQMFPSTRLRQEALKFVQDAAGEWQDFKTTLRDGRVIDTSWAVVGLADGASLGIGQDITARKRADEALREAEQRYRELFENAKDAIYVHDLEGRYLSINPAAEALSGFSRHEILGKTFGEFIAPEYLNEVRDNLCKKLGREGGTSYEVEVMGKGGRRVPVEISSRLIRQNGVPVAVQGTARDITQRKRAEEALRGYSRRLIEAQEEERQRIARELHDQIGQVLTAVQLNLHTVQRLCNTTEASAHVEDGIRVLDEALDQIRDLSFELRPSLLDDLGLAAALRWYADRYAQRTGVRCEIQTDLPHQDVRFARELETACFRIAQEALTNVARHSQAVKVSIQLQTRNNCLLLRVKDDGVGFDVPQLRQRLPSGSTLGLQGMQERAQAVGGSLWVVSAPSQGTQISARFPITNLDPIEI